MSNVTTELLNHAADLRDQGVSFKEIMAETGLSYPQIWNFWAARFAQNNGLAMTPALNTYATKDEADRALGKFAADCRAEGGEYSSWGWITFRAGCGEGRTRKAYERYTNLRSDGQRIGKGGRFATGDARLYSAERKASGVAVEVGMPLIAGLDTPDYEGMTIQQLRAHMNKKGLNPGKAKKSAMIAALLANS